MHAGHTNVQERCGWVQECGGCRTPKNTVDHPNTWAKPNIFLPTLLPASLYEQTTSVDPPEVSHHMHDVNPQMCPSVKPSIA